MDKLSIATLSEATLALDGLQQILGNDLIKYIHRKYGSEGSFFAEELIQQTWIRVWMKSGQCHSKSKDGILRWVYKIARNLGLNMLRDTRKLDEMISLDEDDSENNHEYLNLEFSQADHIVIESNGLPFQRVTEDQAIQQDWLNRWSAKLTERERKAFSLWLYNFSNKQISELMHISKPRVTQLLKQIYKKKPD